MRLVSSRSTALAAAPDSTSRGAGAHPSTDPHRLLPPPDDPNGALEPCPSALEPPEALLSWPPMVRYLDACLMRAVKPWLGALRVDDFADIRTRAYLALTVDPELRGILRQLAHELGRRRK